MQTRRLPAGALVLTLVLGCQVGFAVPPEPVQVQAPQAAPAAPPAAALPNRDGSLKFGVLGDFGTGDRSQFQLGEQMLELHAAFPYELIVTVGDNIYGSERPQDFVRKFENPYKGLLDAKVRFYASLGNHDSPEQRFYEKFNMDGRRYYSFKAPKQDVRFFALESGYMDRDQLRWLERELEGAGEAWKIPYFHHPLYSSGGRHGSDLDLRKSLEPLFLRYGVSVVFTGHDHFYERVKPQQGIVYFVVGSGGKLRRGNLDKRSTLTARGFDTDLAFLAAEIADDELHFTTISRLGTVVDSGVIPRRK
jgi:predicted MPP superfamily phosphohydrolase